MRHAGQLPNDQQRNQVDLDSDGVGDVCDPNPPTSSSDPPCMGLGGDNDNDNYCTEADVDLDYLRDWAKKLDASIGSDEVSERLKRAIEETKH